MYNGICVMNIRAAELQHALKLHRHLCFHNALHLQEATKKKGDKEEEHMETGKKKGNRKETKKRIKKEKNVKQL
jgi:hypothetical protein